MGSSREMYSMKACSAILQADLRSLYAVYGSFGDVFEVEPEKTADQIARVTKEVADRTAERAQKELKLLPFRT